MPKSAKFYVVFNGPNSGIYRSWVSENGAQKATRGVSGCQHKSYKTLEEAQAARVAFNDDGSVL